MRKLLKNPPKIFHVNWFRKSKEGQISLARLRREHAGAEVDRRPLPGPRPAYETPVGWMPEAGGHRHDGAARRRPADLAEALSLNLEEWKREVLLQDELFFKLYSDLPKELIFQRELLISTNSGSEAVEAALKTAWLATKRRGVLAFTGGYHGLGYGALTVTGRDLFPRSVRRATGRLRHLSCPSRTASIARSARPAASPPPACPIA
jgi:hypothetical protein